MCIRDSVLREIDSELEGRWPEDEGPEEWDGVTMINGRVVDLELEDVDLTDAVPAELGQLTSLEMLDLTGNQLTSLPAEIGQLTSLKVLYLIDNRLTIVPAEIGQLASLKWLELNNNQLMSVPAEIGQLTSLERLDLAGIQLNGVPFAIFHLSAFGCDVCTDANVFLP